MLYICWVSDLPNVGFKGFWIHRVLGLPSIGFNKFYLTYKWLLFQTNAFHSARLALPITQQQQLSVQSRRPTFRSLPRSLRSLLRSLWSLLWSLRSLPRCLGLLLWSRRSLLWSVNQEDSFYKPCATKRRPTQNTILKPRRDRLSRLRSARKNNRWGFCVWQTWQHWTSLTKRRSWTSNNPTTSVWQTWRHCKGPDNSIFNIKHVKTVEVFHNNQSKVQMLVFKFQCESNTCIRKAHFLPGICTRPRHTEFWRENTTCGNDNCTLL